MRHILLKVRFFLAKLMKLKPSHEKNKPEKVILHLYKLRFEALGFDSGALFRGGNAFWYMDGWNEERLKISYSLCNMNNIHCINKIFGQTKASRKDFGKSSEMSYLYV